MKKWICVISAVLMLTACGSEQSTSAEPTTAPTPTEEATPTPAISREEAFSGLIYVEDDFDGTRLYRSKFDSKANSEGKMASTEKDFDSFLISIVCTEESTVPMITLRYHGDDWLFFDTVEIKVDDEIFSFSFQGYDRSEEILDDASVLEQYGKYVDDDLFDFLSGISGSSDVTVRFTGDGRYTFNLSRTKKMAIADIISAMKTFRGEA